MVDHYTVTELAFGSRTNPKEKVCIVADVRDKKPTKFLEVWSHSAQKLVKLPRSQVDIRLPGDRWFAISVPRWLLTKERLWAATPASPDDDKERVSAEQSAAIHNKYVQLPGQRMSLSGASAGWRGAE